MMEIDGGKPKSHQFIMKSLWILALLPLSACADETISGYADTGATYRLTHIGEAIFTADATITFPKQGVARGKAPCNTWSATQTAPYPWLSLGPIARTERACPALAAEQTFFDALTTMTLAEVQGATLILSNDAGVEMVFSAENQ